MTPPSSITPAPAHAVFLLDGQGRIVFANQETARLTGLATSRLTGRSVVSLIESDLVSDDPDWDQTYWEVLLATAQNTPTQVNLTADGEIKPTVWLKIEATGQTPATYWAYLVERTDSQGSQPVATPAAGDSLLDGLGVLANQGPAGFFDLNYKTNTIHYSTGWKRMLGYSDSELANSYDTWIELLHPEDSAAAPDQLRSRKVTTRTISFSREFRMKHRDGHYVWIACTGVQIVSSDGQLERVCGLHLDISERKELEELSLESEERLNLLSDDANVAAFDLDFANQRHWFSPAWQRRFNTGLDEIYPTPDPLTQLLPPDQATTGLEALFPPVTPGAQSNGEITLPFLSPTGVAQPVRILYGRQTSRLQELLRLTGLVCPATEADSDAAPDWSNAVLSALAEGVIVADASGHVQALNTKAAKLLHTTPAEAYSRPLTDIFPLIHIVNHQPAINALDLALIDGTPVLCSEHGLRSPSGELHPIVWSARQSRDAESRVTEIIIIFRDPNEMNLTPEELIRANRLESLGLLAGGISHDFNNLLTTILGGISSAKDNREFNHLPDAEAACLAAKTLTRQLLTFAKGGSNAVHQTVPTLDLLQNAVRMAAAGTVCRVIAEASDGINPIRVDRGQIMQVFQNLIINAIQAMPEPSVGLIQIRATNVVLNEDDIDLLPAGDYVQVEVQDNGSGIPPEVAERIFDPFFTTKKSGTGLGLATVLSIVRRHGGQLGMQTAMGEGTTFTVFLPKADQPAEVATRAAPTLRFGTGRILFMDDDPKICELTGGMIASLDYTHDIARTGDEAIQLYRRYLNVNRPYDAVILDLTIIGGMGGEECFQRLREMDPDVRAIASSGYDDDELSQRLIEQGFSGYLTKPYRVGDVGRVLKNALGQ